MNENYAHPSLPDGVEEHIIKGMYRFSNREIPKAAGTIRLLGSGAIFREVIAAGKLLSEDWQVESEIWSVTSFSELAREARYVERWNRLHPEAQPLRSHVEISLGGKAPVIAATDYVRAYPQLIGSSIDGRYVTLGTDGFGRSDTRTALRRFFEVDRYQIVLAALHALFKEGAIGRDRLAAAICRYGIDAEAPAPWTV
jgi:pyruvate dehydrogenase E1 component